MSFRQQVQVPWGPYWENPTGRDPVIYILHKVAFVRCDSPLHAGFSGCVFNSRFQEGNVKNLQENK